MALTHRCNTCDINWPHTDDYERCPCCEKKTTSYFNEPISHEEAWSLRMHAEFERYYANHDAKGLADDIADAEGPAVYEDWPRES